MVDSNGFMGYDAENIFEIEPHFGSKDMHDCKAGSQPCCTTTIISYTYDRRAETHERFYSIEVHRHRFARHARKVPFEKCEHWRKVCGRSAKDQIASTL